MGLISEIVAWFARSAVEQATVSAINTWTDTLSKDYRNDPVYKKKLQELIERNKRFKK
jgi:hypothetical protein